MDGFLVALLVGLSGGLVNLLVDILALWNYDWSARALFLSALVHGYLNRDGRKIYGS